MGLYDSLQLISGKLLASYGQAGQIIHCVPATYDTTSGSMTFWQSAYAVNVLVGDTSDAFEPGTSVLKVGATVTVSATGLPFAISAATDLLFLAGVIYRVTVSNPTAPAGVIVLYDLTLGGAMDPATLLGAAPMWGGGLPNLATLPNDLAHCMPGSWWDNGGMFAQVDASAAGLATILLALPSSDPGDGSPWWCANALTISSGEGAFLSPTPIQAALLALPYADPGDGTPFWRSGSLAVGLGVPGSVSTLVGYLLSFATSDPGDGTPYWRASVLAKETV